MAKKTQEYNDQSIRALKGADRVRKRPGVIFGSDGLDGCQHSFFEILSIFLFGQVADIRFLPEKIIKNAQK